MSAGYWVLGEVSEAVYLVCRECGQSTTAARAFTCDRAVRGRVELGDCETCGHSLFNNEDFEALDLLSDSARDAAIKLLLPHGAV